MRKMRKYAKSLHLEKNENSCEIYAKNIKYYSPINQMMMMNKSYNSHLKH